MKLSAKGVKAKLLKGVETSFNVERDNIGQIVTLQARVPYGSLLCFEYPKSCTACPSGWCSSGICGRNVPFKDEDYIRRPSTCKLRKINLLDLVSSEGIRKSTNIDKIAIKELLNVCFGNSITDVDEPTYNLDDRYYLYFVDNKLVAMSGILSPGRSEYDNYEVDWTCTHPDYRHKGYMQEIFRQMLHGVDSDVYCSCWRIDSEPNLASLMKMFGFELEKLAVETWNCKDDVDCPYRKGNNCNCYEDLYIKRHA